jgi:hypothetical protein
MRDLLARDIETNIIVIDATPCSPPEHDSDEVR